ncbi:MAG TPA: hypothetical protein VNE41_12340 [Chitinophagaceae bacterium]|nr:hypothetical protein [Chitinophagaceae bacterium]
MFRHYLKWSLRNLSKDKLYLIINIGGLAIGICGMLVLLYVSYEKSYDRFHNHAHRIFSVYDDVSFGHKSIMMPYVSYCTAPLAKRTNPSVESFLRTLKPGRLHRFIATRGLKWKIPPSHPVLMAQGTHFVINETAIKTLGLPADPEEV